MRRPLLKIAFLLVAFGGGLVGCIGPITFIAQVTVKATSACNAAKLNKADIWAPYEYWGAVSYLEQAKHRAGFGDFQTAYRYGKKSEKMARKAVKLTRQRKEDVRDEGKKVIHGFGKKFEGDDKKKKPKVKIEPPPP